MQDALLPLGQVGQERGQGHPVVHALHRRVPLAEQVTQVGGVLLAGDRGVQGDRLVRVGQVQPLDHLLLVHVQVPGEIGHGGRAAQPVGQRLVGLGHLDLELLEPARYPHAPAPVPEVLLQLAPYGRPGVVRERAALRVVPVHRLDEPDRGDLYQVLEGLPAALVVPGQPDRERQPQLDHPFPYGGPLPRPPGALVHQRRHRVVKLGTHGRLVVDAVAGHRRKCTRHGNSSPSIRRAAAREGQARPSASSHAVRVVASTRFLSAVEPGRRRAPPARTKRQTRTLVTLGPPVGHRKGLTANCGSRHADVFPPPGRGKRAP